MEKRALSIPEFASLYGLNEATVRVNVSRDKTGKKLPKVMRIGRSIRFTLEAIKEWGGRNDGKLKHKQTARKKRPVGGAI